MLTLPEIQASAVTMASAREARADAEKGLADALETKENHDKKAFELLRAYVQLSLAAFGAAGVFITQQSALGLPFFFAGVAFTVAGGFALLVIRIDRYGVNGSDPEGWLERGVIDGDETTLARMLATVTFFYNDRIKVSRAANVRKAIWLTRSMTLAGITPLFLAVWFLLGL